MGHQSVTAQVVGIEGAAFHPLESFLGAARRAASEKSSNHADSAYLSRNDQPADISEGVKAGVFVRASFSSLRPIRKNQNG